MKKQLEARARLLREAHAFFQSRGYLETETPTLVPSPGLDFHLDAFETNGDAVSRYLITSPEYQMKRLLAEGHPRIYQVVRAYRKGDKGEKHNPEFTILEFYRAPGTAREVMADTEQLVAKLTGGSVTIDGREIRTLPPFSRMSVAEAFERYASVDERTMLTWAETDHDRYYETLAFTVEPRLAEYPEAIFLEDYPAPMASLARKKPSDPRYAERFELYVAGVELCNGFGELTCAREQRERFEVDQRDRRAAGKPVYPIDEAFLAALERGIPECAGNAIGFDRLAALCCGTTEIGTVLAFSNDEL
ncbi:MAG: EF-P lysine aminoacylase EpmA [Polyangiaceae bacterium]